MIEVIPQEWESVRVMVGVVVEIPVEAGYVTVLPTKEEPEKVTVTYFVPESAGSEVESRPVVKNTLKQGEASRRIYETHPTAVPSPSGDAITIYALGQTEEESRVLW